MDIPLHPCKGRRAQAGIFLHIEAAIDLDHDAVYGLLASQICKGNNGAGKRPIESDAVSSLRKMVVGPVL